MRLPIKAFSFTAGLIWGGAIFFVALLNHFLPDYGRAFLEMTASIYPGYEAGTGVGAILLGTVYGMADGAVGGALFAWIYNFILSSTSES